MRIISLLCVVLVTKTAAGDSIALVSDKDTALFPKEQALLLIARVCYTPPSGITAFWTPEEADLSGLESSLESYLKSVAGSLDRPRDWTHYRRQVAGVIVGGKKLLFLSYYDAGPPADRAAIEGHRKAAYESRGKEYSTDLWKREPVTIQDGGATAFRVIYDLGKQEFIWYEENGDA